MSLEPDVLTPGQLMKRLPFKAATFYARQKRGEFRFLEIKRPVGNARYSRRLVDEWVNGGSPTRFGAGARRSA